MENYANTQAYLNTQLEELRENDRARTRQTDQYLAGLWNQYRLLLILGIPTLMFSGCGLAYHQFTIHKLDNIESRIESQKYQDLQKSIDQLKQQKESNYKETCNSFLGMERCHREVK